MPAVISGTNGLTFPTWTTGTRPTPSQAQQGFNTTLNQMEYYDGTSWVAISNTSSQYTWTNTHTFSANIVTTSLTVKEVTETINVSATAATGTIAFDTLTQSSMYLTTNASANWTPNFRANSTVSLNDGMANGESISVAMLVTQGATAYFSNAVQVNATTSGVTTRWVGGTIPTTGNINGIDVYNYTIIKTTTNTFTVLASQALYR